MRKFGSGIMPCKNLVQVVMPSRNLVQELCHAKIWVAVIRFSYYPMQKFGSGNYAMQSLVKVIMSCRKFGSGGYATQKFGSRNYTMQKFGSEIVQRRNLVQVITVCRNLVYLTVQCAMVPENLVMLSKKIDKQKFGSRHNALKLFGPCYNSISFTSLHAVSNFDLVD